MPHEFEVRKEIEFQATPEEVWEAIATGTGYRWLVPRHRQRGRARSRRQGADLVRQRGSRGRLIDDHDLGAAPRFAYRGDPHPDGTFHAIEYVVEGRAGGTTVVRLVHSGMLGDDWESEYDALNEGDFMYLHQMTAVRHPLPRPAGEARDGLAAGHRSGPGDGDAAHRDGCLGRPERG